MAGVRVGIDGARRLLGRARPAGDKSISHRALMFAGLGSGRCTVTGANAGEDVRSTAACLRGLGVNVNGTAGVYTVEGRGFRWRPATDALDCGNSGTTMRLLAGILAGQPFTSTLVGDESLSRRPMGRIARPLRALGARVEGPSNGDRAPLVITGDRSKGGDVHRFDMSVASAQVKSCLLLAGLLRGQSVEILEPAASRDHTERMLAARGVPIEFSPGRVRMENGASWSNHDVRVPADPSAAALIAICALMVPGSRVELEGVLDSPARSGFVGVLQRMGVTAEWRSAVEVEGERVADLVVEAPPATHVSSTWRAVEVSASEIPSLIDEVPALAVVAALAEGTSVFQGVGELRVKESDRVQAIENTLGRFGVHTESDPDRLVVHGGTLRRPESALESSDDHRIAMVQAALALGVSARDGGGPLDIDLAATAVSDPEFSQRLARLQSNVADA